MTNSPQDDETLPIARAANAPVVQQPHRRVGEYELLAEIARGGMGIVYRARHVTLNRLVAVKMIRQSDMASSMERQRFAIEAEAVAALEHPNIVPIFDVGELDGQPYFAMKLIDGGSLHDALLSAEWTIGQKNTVRQSVTWMREIAGAVHHAHQQGIIHRDLKPGNILVDQSDHLFVADFGLAKRLGSNDGQTQTGAMIGTPEYMSPEQMLGKPAGVQSDIYSLGTILYRMLAGRTPFQSDSAPELFQLTIHQPVPSLRKLNQQVDKDLETICVKCLEKQPEQRYGSALELAHDLERWERGDPVRARPLGPLVRSLRWARSRPVNMAIAVLSCLLLAVLSLALWAGYYSTQYALDLYREQWKQNTIRMAADALEIGQPLDAERFLTQVEDRRGDESLPWEWHYLRNKLPIAFRLPVNDDCVSAYSPDGMLAVVDRSRDFKLVKFSLWLNADRGDLEEPPQKVFERPLDRLDYWPNLKMKWSKDGRFLALGLTRSVEIWDTKTRKLEWKIPCSIAPNDIEWNQDFSPLIITSSLETNLFDFSQRVLLRTRTHNRPVHNVTWVEDARLAFDFSDATKFVDADTLDTNDTWDFSVIDWSPDCGQWVSEKGIGNSESKQLVHQIDLNRSATWSPDGKLIAYRIADQIIVIRASDGKQINAFHGVDLKPMSWFPDSSRLVVGNQVLEDFDWRAEDSPIEQPETVDLVRAFPDGNRAALVLANSNQIQVVDTRGVLQSQFGLHSEPVKHLDVSRDNSTIASVDKSGVVCVWSSADGSLIARWSNLAEGKTTESVDPVSVVFLSPDKQFCAASLEGSTIVWRPDEPTPLYSFQLKGSRAIGWSNDPLALQIYTGFEKPKEPIRQRQVIQFPQAEKYDYMVSWEPKTNAEHRYTLLISKGVSQTPLAIYSSATTNAPTRSIKTNIGLFSDPNKISAISLESYSRQVEAFADHPFIVSRPDFQTYSFGNNDTVHLTTDMFASVSRNGYLSLWESGEKLHWTFPTKYSPKSHLSYSSGRFWIADGKHIHVLKGTSRPLGSRETTRVAPVTYITLFLPGSFILVIPVWLLVDRGIRISHAAKWFVALVSISAGITFAIQIELDNMRSPIVYLLVVIVNLLAGIGIASMLLEPIRMLIAGKWKMSLISIMVFLMGVSCLVVYNLWPKPWALEGGSLSLLWIVLFAMTIGLLLLTIRISSWRSLPMVNVPNWVRIGMWGQRSLGELLVTGALGISLGIAGLVVMSRSEYELWIILLPLVLLLLVGSLLNFSTAFWLMRNGGISSHIAKKKILTTNHQAPPEKL